MNPVITTFPVDNGDMTLFQLESGRSILVDVNIRAVTDGVPDVLADLRARLRKDSVGRHYVDAMLLTHPDQDHCRGIEEHFHMGPIVDYVQPKEGPGKIVIREMWSSPMVFRRQSPDHQLCADAAAWCKEARRRANHFKAADYAIVCERIQIMGEDETNPETGKSRTDGLEAILVKAGETIRNIDGQRDGTFSGFLIAPKGQGTAAEEERRSKNHSSVIINFSIANGTKADATKYLAGGDALVGIWERVWDDHRYEPHVLQYNILSAPHHCSWRSLSHESWKVTNGRAAVSESAKSALRQALTGAFVVASSKEVHDDKDDPPCIGAKRQYEDILSAGGGKFMNTATHASNGAATPMEFRVLATGPVLQDPGSSLGIALVEEFDHDPLAAPALKGANDKGPVQFQEQNRFA